jgi:hypothetical protein
MNTIEPFNYNELVPYNHAYLSGFYAEKYDEEGLENFREAGNRALNSTKEYLQNDARRYTSKVITNDGLQAEEMSKEYVMLPVWMVNVKYKNKMYTFAMNGESGEFIGNIPLSASRTLVYTLIIWVISFIGCIIGSYILYLITR